MCKIYNINTIYVIIFRACSKKSIICIFTNYDQQEYFGRCEYCKSGRLKWIKNIDLFGVLKENKIIHKLLRRP